MYNDLFSIGSITIHGYGLMIGIGVILAMITSDKRARDRGLDDNFIYSLVFITVVGGFACAKVLYIFTDLKAFIKDPIGFLGGNGFVVFGGIIGGIAIIYLCCRIKKYKFIDYIDLMVPAVALAQGFGRLGCLLAGCCYGRETDSIIGIVFKHSDFAPNNVKLLPTQIIMSVGDFIIAAILYMYVKKYDQKNMIEGEEKRLPTNTGGRVTCLYIMLYSVGRFFVEFLRNDYRGNIGILSTSQFIGIIMAVVTANVMFFILPRINKKVEVEDIKSEVK